MRAVSIRATSNWQNGGTREVPVTTTESVPLHELLLYVGLFYWAIRTAGIVPPRQIINAYLIRGTSGGSTEWEPFTLTGEEYDELSATLAQQSSGYCIVDETLWSPPDYSAWQTEVRRRFREDTYYKPLHWRAQCNLLGIPVGPDAWISLAPIPVDARFANADTILGPLEDFLETLMHCEPVCCGWEAFDFSGEAILASVKFLDCSHLVAKLHHAILSLENQEPSFPHLRCEFLGSRFWRSELIDLLKHVLDVISWPDAVNETSQTE